ncbi:hypothetical protein GIB67_000476 [Kingdonia uniflora]|uniref:Uncharacterized protein n=1 Tax=Kingdonia uniflora TaxID=39325 RepID=A0A7J7L0I6_9MAGN|nr:hypothetical protein GIB67_000476 [Kingdonia uniflora]
MNMRGHNNFTYSLDTETMELFSITRAQEEEILRLREHISDACVKELQLLNEKHSLERKFSDLRMTIDEKQNEALTSSLKELAHRKGDLEENLKLALDLKAVEDERYYFTSSMLSLLAEYGFRPHVINASAISNSAKHLYDQLQWKVRTSHVSSQTCILYVPSVRKLGGKIATRKHKINKPELEVLTLTTEDSNQSNKRTHKISIEASGDGPSNKDHQISSVAKDQHTEKSMVSNVYYPSDMNVREGHLDSASNISRFARDQKEVEGHKAINSFEDGERVTDPPYLVPVMQEEHTAVSEEDFSPGIDGFQIIGDAKPGNTLQGCGYPVRGTSLCMFQWVRHLQNGTWHYIDGATNPDYVVTADDIDKLIAVECIPMDDNGRQGELVRLFANEQKKIACDPEMQLEVENYIATGLATFNVLLWVDSSEAWQPTIFILKRSSYQIKVDGRDVVVLEEKFSSDLSVKIPVGLSAQFVLTCADGTSHPFSTHNDVRNE